MTPETLYSPDIIAEECCELCGETIHNHFDVCPACGEKYAPTTIYGSLYEHREDAVGCESCGAQFRLVEGDPYDGLYRMVQGPHRKP